MTQEKIILTLIFYQVTEQVMFRFRFRFISAFSVLSWWSVNLLTLLGRLRWPKRKSFTLWPYQGSNWWTWLEDCLFYPLSQTISIHWHDIFYYHWWTASMKLRLLYLPCYLRAFLFCPINETNDKELVSLCLTIPSMQTEQTAQLLQGWTVQPRCTLDFKTHTVLNNWLWFCLCMQDLQGLLHGILCFATCPFKN